MGHVVLLYLAIRRGPCARSCAARARGTPLAEPRASTTGDTLRAYIALTKPRIISLLLVTTVPTMVLAQQGVPSVVADGRR